MLKELLRDSEFKWYVIVLLVCGGISIYYYLNPSNQRSIEYVSVKGVLREKPEFVTPPENTNYIQLSLEGQEKRFNIRGCALSMIRNEDVLKLQIGDSVKLDVLKKEFVRRKNFILNKTMRVYGIELHDKGRILGTAEIDHCNKNTWKNLSFLFPFAALIFLIQIIRKLQKAKSP